MKSTHLFEQIVQIDRPSVADEFLERTTPLIFEKEYKTARVELRCLTTSDLSRYRRIAAESQTSTNTKTPVLGANLPSVVQIAPDSDTRQLSLQLQTINVELGKLRSLIRTTKGDFRIFYLRQRNSFSRLKITKELFQVLVDDCEIFARFSEHVIDLRWKKMETEIGPPPIRFRFFHHQAYECAYGIRFAEFTNRPAEAGEEPPSPWSLRQFSVYHKHIPDSDARCSTWILVGQSQRTEKSLDRYLKGASEFKDMHPFELHLIFLDTAIASWRPYIACLLEREAQVSDKVVAMMDDEADQDFIAIKLNDYRLLKNVEDRISDVVLCLDSTLDTLETFMEMHKLHFLVEESFEGQGRVPIAKSAVVDSILFVLKEKQREVAYARKKAESLLAKAQNTRALISSLLERQTGHNLDQQMTALRHLESEACDENAIMRQLAEKSSRDSTSVRILTIITLIYLPCTVVSSFYSTQFVDQTERPGGGHNLEYMDNAWLFFAVSGPLTLFTITVWYTWSHFRTILDMSLCKTDRHTVSFTERFSMMGLLKKRRELPR